MTKEVLTNELIRASAGTGKTYQLTNRYLRLLRSGQRADEILATTFTRKAAGEILNRLLLRLAKAATDAKELRELESALDDGTLSQDECLGLLVDASRSLHRLRVGTLDSFFAQLAGSFSLELGLPPGWRIAEEYVDAALREQAVDAVLDGDSTAELLTLVHALTRGETTRSLQREVRDKVNSLYTVYRESDPKAWQQVPRSRMLSDAQLEDAIDSLRTIPLPTHKTWEKNHAKDIAAAEEGDWADFVAGGIAGKVAAGEENYCRKPIEPAVAAVYQSLIDHAKAVLLNQLADQTEATFRLLDKFHQHYQRLKSQARALRFDDVTFRLAEQFHPLTLGEGRGESPDDFTQDIAFRLDAHLHHLLLDEFQDTSLAQWVVVRPFAKRITSDRRGSPDSAGTIAAPDSVARSGDRPQRLKPSQSFFCVGDVKQAIYGWRGGVAEIFDAVKDELDGIVERPLNTNWRSSPRVIDTVNQIFSRLNQHGNLGDLADAAIRWQKQFQTHETAPKNKSLNGYVCLQAARVASENESESQKEITLRFAAEQVARWKKEAPGYEIGVLVRRNDAVRRLIYELRELGIEASEEGGSSLDDSAAVRLVLSLIQLADHPSDLIARYHLATSPIVGSLGQLDESNSTLTASELFSSEATAGRFAARVRRQLIDTGYGPMIYRWARQLAPVCNRRELRRLEKLIGLAYQYDSSASTRPRDFIAYVDSQRVRDPVAADVRIMTVHQAKGLEFDIVVLADLEADLIGQRGALVIGRPSPTEPIDRICRRCGKEVRQLLPESWQKLFRAADDQDMTESLCVLYVAATRPVHALHMIVAPSTPTERSLYKTFGGLLRATLTDGNRLESEQIAYTCGDAKWFENPGIERTPSESEILTQEESLAPIAVQLAPPAERRQRGLLRVSPSGLEGGTHVRLSDGWGDGGTQRTAALQRGTLIHAWFEQIHWLEDGQPDDALLRQVTNEVIDVALSDDEFVRLLADFRTMLAHPSIATCLSQEHSLSFWERAGVSDAQSTATLNLRVENERPIAVRHGDQLMVGNIDRLVTIYQNRQPIAADIIDFKTDAIASDDKSALRKKSEYYRPQLEAYRQAAAQILALDTSKISAKLMFVGPGLVCPVD